MYKTKYKGGNISWKIIAITGEMTAVRTKMVAKKTVRSYLV